MRKYTLPYFQLPWKTADGRPCVYDRSTGQLIPLDPAQEALFVGAGGNGRPVIAPIDAAGRTFAPGDDGGDFQVTSACTLKFPENLEWVDGIRVKLPDSGSVIFIGDGTTLVNDVTTASTRTKGAGQRVVVVTPARRVNGVQSLDLSGI